MDWVIPAEVLLHFGAFCTIVVGVARVSILMRHDPELEKLPPLRATRRLLRDPIFAFCFTVGMGVAAIELGLVAYGLWHSP